jgi:CRISPR-associated protein Cas5t
MCLDGNPELEERVRRGLQGGFNAHRYGVPFLGDNQFLVDRLEERPLPQPAYWYERIDESVGTRLRQRTERLTIWIDRSDMSKTRSALYAPLENPTEDIPKSAWTDIRPPADEPLVVSKAKRKKG